MQKPFFFVTTRIYWISNVHDVMHLSLTFLCSKFRAGNTICLYTLTPNLHDGIHYVVHAHPAVLLLILPLRLHCVDVQNSNYGL